MIINTLIFFKLVDLNFYHKALLTKSIVLNTSKIENKLKFKSIKTSRDILFENYKYYIKNINKINEIKSGSNKKPNLKIFNLFKYFFRT